MSILLTAHDVRKQRGLTSICSTSDGVKVSVIARSLSSTQQAFFIAHRRWPLNFFYDYFIARTKVEGTLEYDNTKLYFLQPYCCCRYRSICGIKLGPFILMRYGGDAMIS
jgi:hypothetical protein